MTDRLASLSTWWTLIQQAHAGSAEEAAAARCLLVERYHSVVYRYLLGIIRDAGVAEELAQEFGLALVSKKFQKASPASGRFRDYVKAVLRHLVLHHYKKQKRAPKQLENDLADVRAPTEDEFDSQFTESWRAQLLARTWEALQQSQPQLHVVLRYRADHPDRKSPAMTGPLGDLLGKEMTAENVRQMLRRARRKFGDLLIHEVACSLDAPTADSIEEELLDLRLIEYCKDALERYRQCPD